MYNYQFWRSIGVYHDLAIEARDLLRGDANVEIEGVKETVREHGFATVTTIEILNQEGAEAMGRPPGRYITIEVPQFIEDRDLVLPTGGLLADILKQVLPPGNGKTWLLAGLGNPEVTADGLGPQFIKVSMPTRHYFLHMPKDVSPGFSSVALLSPDVLGSTGLESLEVVGSVARKIQPAAVIIVDALAAGAINRVGTSFQIADTGIVPGSGVGNHRKALNEETIGAPVIAIGVPTVVYLQIIIGQVLNRLRELEKIEAAWEREGQQLLSTLLEPGTEQFAVTPKNIDEINESVASAIAIGTHLALHPALNRDNIGDYINVNI